MLIRFVVKNLFSFKEQTEFNLLPGKVKRLSHHKYTLTNGVEVLKASAIYGANGAGKSNLIKAMALLQEMLIKGNIPSALANGSFKLSPSAKEQSIELGIEFFTGGINFYYSISVNGRQIEEEYFARINDLKEDELIYLRKKDSIQFSLLFEKDSEFATLKKIIEKDLLKPEKPLFNLLNTISNTHFDDIRTAWYWLEHRLEIIFPNSKHASLVHEFASNQSSANFASSALQTFNTGISRLEVKERPMQEYFGKESSPELEELIETLKDKPDETSLILRNNETREDILLKRSGEKFFVRHLLFEHNGEKNQKVEFKLSEESDGTKRLLDYLPALSDIVNDSYVYVIDEIERSIHPSLIKELIKKFSEDEQTKGQLIFTTHESNLLDQDILRTDEIWFTEKNLQGATALYPLSDFKEHSTIDIRKGYLTGRYGAIPFLGDLKQLNWHARHAEQE